MKIAHVVTLVSPDGAYGGPLRVAVNQCRVLKELGHETVIFAGSRDWDVTQRELEGIELRTKPVRSLVPFTGFAGLIAPGLNRLLRQSIDEFDAFHVHVARDLVTLPAARLAQRAGKRYALQTHGMIDRSDKLLAKPVDMLFTRPTFCRASAVFYLNDADRRGVEEVVRSDLPFVHLPNGVPRQPTESTRISDRQPLEVLFLARLQHRKRPMAFVGMALTLVTEFPDVRFTLVGPDEGEAASVKQAIAESGFGDRIHWAGPLDPERTIERMQAASIYVLPSVEEPFPMSVLEALSVGLPVVITASNGLAPAILERGAGLVVDGSVEGLVGAVRSLLDDSSERLRVSQRAVASARADYSMTAIGRQLVSTYSGFSQ